LDHIPARGCALFDIACASDLEGIVGKWVDGSYQTDGRSTSWLKVKNPKYTQIRDRHELFDARQHHRAISRRQFTPALRLI
jgi:ATP-dependent DNA ligase